MLIGGLQKTTLLDFPGKVSALVFTVGCNFTCPYCHNGDLVLGRQDPLSNEAVFDFLAQRKNVLQGVVISGGEPTLHEDLPGFCAKIKSLGYSVKLDTNGSRPEMLAAVLHSKLVDYVALDIKADPAHYPREIAPEAVGQDILRTLEIVQTSGVVHELRLPCVAPFITADNLPTILGRLAKTKAPIFLQEVRLKQVLHPQFFIRQGRVLTRGEIEELASQGHALGYQCLVR
jgi:pyruvate formate lyase activating enzyme